MSRYRRPSLVDENIRNPQQVASTWTLMLEPDNDDDFIDQEHMDVWQHIHHCAEIVEEQRREQASKQKADKRWREHPSRSDLVTWSCFCDSLMCVPNQQQRDASSSSSLPAPPSSLLVTNGGNNSNNNSSSVSQHSVSTKIVPISPAYPPYVSLVRCLFPWVMHDVFENVSYMPGQIQMEIGFPYALAPYLTQFIATVFFVGFESAVQQKQAEFLLGQDPSCWSSASLPFMTEEELCELFRFGEDDDDDEKKEAEQHNKTATTITSSRSQSSGAGKMVMQQHIRMLAEMWHALRLRTIGPRFPQGCPVVWVGLRRVEGTIRATVDPKSQEGHDKRRRVIHVVRNVFAKHLDRILMHHPIQAIPTSVAPALAVTAKAVAKHVERLQAISANNNSVSSSTTATTDNNGASSSSSSSSSTCVNTMMSIQCLTDVAELLCNAMANIPTRTARAFIPDSTGRWLLNFLTQRFPARLALVVRERGVSAVYVERPAFDADPVLYLLHNDGSVSVAVTLSECLETTTTTTTTSAAGGGGRRKHNKEGQPSSPGKSTSKKNNNIDEVDNIEDMLVTLDDDDDDDDDDGDLIDDNSDDERATSRASRHNNNRRSGGGAKSDKEKLFIILEGARKIAKLTNNNNINSLLFNSDGGAGAGVGRNAPSLPQQQQQQQRQTAATAVVADDDDTNDNTSYLETQLALINDGTLAAVLHDVLTCHPLYPLLVGCGVKQVSLSRNCTVSNVSCRILRSCGSTIDFDILEAFFTDPLTGNAKLHSKETSRLQFVRSHYPLKWVPPPCPVGFSVPQGEGSAAEAWHKECVLPPTRQTVEYIYQSVWEHHCQQQQRKQQQQKYSSSSSSSSSCCSAIVVVPNDVMQCALKHILRCHPLYFDKIVGCGVKRLVIAEDDSVKNVARSMILAVEQQQQHSSTTANSVKKNIPLGCFFVERVCGTRVRILLSDCFMDYDANVLYPPMVPAGQIAFGLANASRAKDVSVLPIKYNHEQQKAGGGGAPARRARSP